MRHKSLRTTLATTAAAFALGAMLAAPTARALDLDGKRIEVIVPFGEGGGTDTYTRFIAPLWHEKLPGDSTLVIRNIPGAGSIAGANQFQDRAEPDGLTLLAVSTSTLFNFVLDDPRVDYNPREWTPVVVSPLGNVLYVHSKLGVEEATKDGVAKLRETGLILGANGPTSSDLPVLVGLDMLGIPVKPVFGLNRGKSRQALERGEFTVSFDNTGAYRQSVLPLVESGVAVPLMTRGYVDDEGKIITDPGNPDLPTLDDVYERMHGEAPSGPQYEAYNTLINTSVMASKALVLPEGTPQEVVDVYREAMRELVEDPEFDKKAERFLGGYPSLLGEAAEKRLQSATTLSPEAEAWLFQWLRETHDFKR